VRVELLHTYKPHSKLKQGDTGTVVSESLTQSQRVLMVNWDSGFTHNLVWGKDSWKILSIDTKPRHLYTW
jgi:hypothetical protein